MVRAMVTVTQDPGRHALTATTVITPMPVRPTATTGLIGFPAGSSSGLDPGSVAASASMDSLVLASVGVVRASVDAVLIEDSTAAGSAVVSHRVPSFAGTWAAASMAEATASTAAEETSIAAEDFTAVAASTVEAAFTEAGTGNSVPRFDLKIQKGLAANAASFFAFSLGLRRRRL